MKLSFWETSTSQCNNTAQLIWLPSSFNMRDVTEKAKSYFCYFSFQESIILNRSAIYLNVTISIFYYCALIFYSMKWSSTLMTLLSTYEYTIPNLPSFQILKNKLEHPNKQHAIELSTMKQLCKAKSIKYSSYYFQYSVHF